MTPKKKSKRVVPARPRKKPVNKNKLRNSPTLRKKKRKPSPKPTNYKKPAGSTQTRRSRKPTAKRKTRVRTKWD
jgi:hypothetical protein